MAERTTGAARLHRPSWRDSRLLLGVLIFASAVALGSYLVSRADDRVPMYASASVLSPGQSLTEELVTRVDVRLGDGIAGYLSAAEPLPADQVLLREVRPGELIPLSAVGGVDQAALSQIAISVDPTVAAPLTAGTVVDVFVNRLVESEADDAYTGPQRLLEGVSVAAVDTSGRGLGSTGRGTAVRIMVPIDQVPDLIEAVDREAKITVVPVPGAVVRTGG
ncbi:MAG: hypothetical protein GX344_14395 [Intrasporangiaceae bacterium]|nr:hypothetical protein [Intrasporangiaceae bacterium]